jgi:HSP20 family protein
MYRRYRVPAAWKEVDRLQREMNQLFDAHTPSRFRRASGYPAMNAWANEEGLTVTAEVPGVSPSDIDISVVGETLTLSGNRKSDDVDENSRYHRQERGYGKFSRSIQLPFPISVDEVDATFKNGILQINLPRAEEDKPKKIAVKSV